MQAKSPVKATLHARIIRADGRVEDLGEVAFWHRNPLRRWWWRLAHILRR